jgi:glyoxylase-like metal-dependent hydrolase (beta-lactamase superfamily II)
VYLLDDRVLFTGDSLAWSMREKDLVAFRDACWYSSSALGASLAKLADYRFEWVLPGHGWPVHCPAQEMTARLHALVTRMRSRESSGAILVAYKLTSRAASRADSHVPELFGSAADCQPRSIKANLQINTQVRVSRSNQAPGGEVVRDQRLWKPRYAAAVERH